jgi:hypothetical protein
VEGWAPSAINEAPAKRLVDESEVGRTRDRTPAVASTITPRSSLYGGQRSFPFGNPANVLSGTMWTRGLLFSRRGGGHSGTVPPCGKFIPRTGNIAVDKPSSRSQATTPPTARAPISPSDSLT